MAQFNWTYLSPKGKNFIVGLYHGRSGHVIVHCNNKIVLIDFNVLETKTYSFYIEEELFELTLERNNDVFSYGLKINEEAHTPMNEARKLRARKDNIRIALFFSAFVLVIALSVWLSGRYMKKQTLPPAAISALYVETLSTVTVVRLDGDSSLIAYAYKATDGKTYKGTVKLPKDIPLTPSGMPIHDGDEFFVLYPVTYPGEGKILWEKFSDRQIERWMSQAVEVHKRLHPSWTEEQIECRVQAAFDIKSTAGLASIIFQNLPPRAGLTHHRQTYQRLIRDLPYQNYVAKNCS